jgi:predicted metal-dependent HD superfamily phosphohydrolase
VRHLADAWITLARRAGAREDVAGTGAALLGRWSERHRAYHDLAHLDEVLHRIDLLAGEADRPDLVRLAAWFHDAVYDPRATDNEERSAEVATVALAALGLAPDVVDEVARLVQLTATHAVTPGDRDGAVLCDADLAVLASDSLRYQSYVDGVRREYAHLDDPIFAQGRADVLRRLLDRPRLFTTSYGHREWEQPARANVAAETRSLLAD